MLKFKNAATAMPVQQEPLVSPLAADPMYRPLLTWFVRGLSMRLDAMEQAVQLRQWQEVITLAEQLRAAGESYGYPAIREAAAEVRGVAEQADAGASAESVQRLRNYCDAAWLGVREAG